MAVAEEPSSTGSPRLQIHYVKTQAYRELPVHGVIGGLTPRGDLWMAPYAERGPLPRTMEYEAEIVGAGLKIDESAQPVSVDTKAGMVRVVEAGFYLDLNAAKRLQIWLNERIAQMEGKNAERADADR